MPNIAVCGLPPTLATRARATTGSAAGNGSRVVVHEGEATVSGQVRAALGDPTLDRVVLVSSAMVYGAWPDNPVPLPEDAPLRPNPGCGDAADRAEAERIVQQWERAGAGRSAVVLRPPVIVGGSPPRSRREGPAPLPVRDATAPVQFLHEDDLLAAVDVGVRGALDGVYNVAPDGWVSAETARALVFGPLTPRLPAKVLHLASSAARFFGRSRGPGGLAYRLHPWVVANDRLRATGWVPAHTNEEAWVVSQPGSRVGELSPSRRQAIALGGLGGGIVAGGVAIAALVRRRSSRR